LPCSKKHKEVKQFLTFSNSLLLIQKLCSVHFLFVSDDSFTTNFNISISFLGGEDSSRHEQFSDTIFWCVDLIFTKQLEDGTSSQYSYRVQNIPETIRVETVLRQFFKPRQHGCIVSKSDLDMEKMAPFIEAGIESVNGFMLVPNMEYYGINFGKDFLHNMRNRVIVNHPRIIITLNTEFISSHQVGCLIPICALNHSLCSVPLIFVFGSIEGSDRCAMRRGRGGFRGGFRAGQGGPRVEFRGGLRDGGDRRRDYGTQRGSSRDRFKVF
uniref:Helicase C-terminal domain-containing protein n=1 Tax=Angiostrongylus cantonensis TaxID=6313 RepID=A0A0K0DFW2_ANGCA